MKVDVLNMFTKSTPVVKLQIWNELWMIKVDLIQSYSAPSNVTKISNNVTFISKQSKLSNSFFTMCGWSGLNTEFHPQIAFWVSHCSRPISMWSFQWRHLICRETILPRATLVFLNPDHFFTNWNGFLSSKPIESCTNRQESIKCGANLLSDRKVCFSQDFPLTLNPVFNPDQPQMHRWGYMDTRCLDG